MELWRWETQKLKSSWTYRRLHYTGGHSLIPVLDLARQKGLTYRWGFPVSVSFCGESGIFNLQSTADLPALFEFLVVDPIPVPVWLQLLPRLFGRPGPPAVWSYAAPPAERKEKESFGFT